MQNLVIFTGKNPPSDESLQEGVLWLLPGPEKSKGTILICPGGGYLWLSPREAQPVAEAFINAGWTAAVLYYKTRPDANQLPLDVFPVRQLGQAIAQIRDLYPDSKVITCGFSAGGHLVATLGVHWKTLGLHKPDAQILCYPVITAGEYTHPATMDNLTGGNALKNNFFSLELHVGAHVPPTFLWHTVTDTDVPVQNSILLAKALSDAGVKYEMHLYPRGVHGLSLATPEVEEPQKQRFADSHIAGWFDHCLTWLESY